MKKKRIFRYQLKNKIRSWVNKVARTLDSEYVKKSYRFEDNKDGSFLFCYDGALYEVLYTGVMHGFEFNVLSDLNDDFDNLFYNSGWSHDFEEGSVIHCFKKF